MSAKEEDAVPQKFNFTSEKSKWVLDEAGKRRRRVLTRYRRNRRSISDYRYVVSNSRLRSERDRERVSLAWKGFVCV